VKCCHNVLRNGYWTGRRCSRDATTAVQVGPGADLSKTGNRLRAEGEEVPMCAQHARKFDK
jgi:hypothetical protein